MAWLMLLMGAVAFMISWVSTRVSRSHDSTSLWFTCWRMVLPSWFSASCMARSPGSNPWVGRRKVKSRLRTASCISQARRFSRR